MIKNTMNGLIQLLNSHGIPQDFVIKAAFYFIATLTLVFALFVVLSRHIFRAAVYLAVVLTCIACVYLFLDAEFLAVVQVLIYVGAIVVLFIFTVMLTADIDSGTFAGTLRRMSVAAVASLAIFFILFKVINMVTAWKTAVPAGVSINLSQLGKSLMTGYALPFEVISLVSLAALVGALVIGKAEKR
jgi:NADH-quinone oxidoreductase subunit J